MREENGFATERFAKRIVEQLISLALKPFVFPLDLGLLRLPLPSQRTKAQRK